jgi:hypothetical protein
VKVKLLSFGQLEIDGKKYEQDVVIDRGRVRKRKKAPSKTYRDQYGHTPLSIDEQIPWSGHRLIVGTGASGQLPVMPEVYAEARRRKIELVAVPTREACKLINEVDQGELAAILHVTC